MTPELNETIVDVVGECHEIVRNLELKGASLDDANAVEKAIDMAIERRFSSKPKEQLLGDVLCNGHFSVRRSRAREARFVEKYGGHLPRVRTGKRRVPGDFASPDSTEVSCLGMELGRELSKEAARCGSHGPQVLESLVQGDTVSATARRAGVSTSTVNRVIRQLRRRAVELGYGETT